MPYAPKGNNRNREEEEGIPLLATWLVPFIRLE
jgi:hypothetical protein